MIQKTVLFSTAKIAWGGLLLFIDILAMPTFNLFFVLCGAIMLDFLTGILKAKFKKQARTSEGYRRTVVKVMQYITPVLILWLASNRIPEYQKTLKEISGWLMLFIIYVEVTSIFENLYEIDKNSVIARFLYKPALKILKFGIENNAVRQAADELKEQQKPSQN